MITNPMIDKLSIDKILKFAIRNQINISSLLFLIKNQIILGYKYIY